MMFADEAAYTIEKVSALLRNEAFCDQGLDEEVRLYSYPFIFIYSLSQLIGTPGS